MRAFQSAGTYSTRRCALPFTRYELDVPGIYQGRIRLTNLKQSMCRSQTIDLDMGEVHEEDRRRIPNGIVTSSRLMDQHGGATKQKQSGSWATR